MTALESWMTEAACVRRRDLPWIDAPETVGLGEEATMGVTCERCPVLGACLSFVRRERITSGFWAGDHRDPDTGDAIGGAA